MKIQLLYLFLLGVFFPCQASDENAYHQGQSFAQSSMMELPSDVSQVPGYQDPTAFGQSINEKNIDQAAQNASQKSQEASLLRQTYTTRSRFDLDEKADPLFTDADEVILNPEKKMNLEASTRTFKVGTSQHTCTKGYDLLERKCKWWPVTEKTGMSQEVKTEVIYIHNHKKNRMADTTFRQAQNDPTTYLSSSIHLFKKYYTGKDALSGKTILINTNRILSFRLLTTKTGHYSTWEFSSSDNNDWFQESWWSYPEFIQLEVKHLVDVPVYTLTWQNDCDDLEGLADTGACEYSEKKCIEGEGTRIIEGTPVYAKCWREEAI